MSDRRVLLDTASFMDAPQARALGLEPGAVRTIAQRFLTACYEDLGMAPRLLDGSDMERLLTDALPRQFGVRDPLAPQVEAVVGAYLDFLVEHAVVSASFEQRRALASHVGIFAEVVASGAAQALGPVGRAAPTVRHTTEKTGRNDPCPCGSGRKFKKCCQRLA